MLLNALGSQSDVKMKSIVSTIQREQNKIIRNTAADLLFVQGAAGSGKTAAILQRVAFLLYRYRGNLNAGQVIMFSPNQLFNDYVDQVLPELGEQNMIQMTYYQFTRRRIPNIDVENLQQRLIRSSRMRNVKSNNSKEACNFSKLLLNMRNILGRQVCDSVISCSKVNRLLLRKKLKTSTIHLILPIIWVTELKELGKP